MTDKEKLKEIKKLADAMYYAAFNMTTDASLLRKAMNEYHQFIIYQYFKKEPVSDDFEKALTEMIANAQKCVVEPIVVAQQWKDYLVELAKSEEPVSEELEKIVEEITEPTVLNAYGTKELARRLRNTVIYGTSVSKELDEVAELYTLDDSIKPWRNLTKEAFKAGANWQKLQDMGITNKKAQDVVTNLLSSADNPLDAYATEVAFMMLPATLKESYHQTNRDRIGDAVKLGAKWQLNQIRKENAKVNV